jgi:hypothetical protein
MPSRFWLATALTISASCAFAQWSDVRQIGIGGESTIASDNAGNIYVTSHLPCSLWQSKDWGDTFQRTFRFPDSLGDMHLYLRPNHKVNVSYVRLKINGLSDWRSEDGGLTLTKGKNFNGPLDREWLTSNAAGDLFMDYSNGYIGGPKSKGLFLAKSTNDGESFTQIARVDHEKKGSYPVDPYIATNSRNRMFCMWATSVDYDTVDSFKLSFTDNGGKSFSKPQTVANFPQTLDGEKVDVQERWMLGDFLPVGDDKLIVIYPEYSHIQVDGKAQLAFLLYCRTSYDGGQTFGKGKPALPQDETIAAIRDFNKAKLGTDHTYYIQTLPWLCKDPAGRVYLAFTDNRAGQTTYREKVLNRWQVRCATCFNLHNGFTWSEQVSHLYQSKRPPQDFLSCTADSKMLYVSWTENPNVSEDWPKETYVSFTGNLFVARKKLP